MKAITLNVEKVLKYYLKSAGRVNLIVVKTVTSTSNTLVRFEIALTLEQKQKLLREIRNRKGE